MFPVGVQGQRGAGGLSLRKGHHENHLPPSPHQETCSTRCRGKRVRYFRTGIRIAGLMAWVLILATALLAQDQQLRLNPHLDYNSDSVEGPLITGNDTKMGVVQGKPNYVMIYSE